MNGARYWKLPFALLLVTLAASQIVTDFFGATQFVWWIPRVLLAGSAVLGFALLLAIASIARWSALERKRLRAWLALSVAIGVWCTWTDWGFVRARPAGAFRLAHWNACHANDGEAVACVDAMLSFDADAMIITDPGASFSHDGAQRLAAAGYQIMQPGSFAIVSRVPILHAQPLFSARGRVLSRIELLTAFGPLRIEAVDLPSETTLPRYASMVLFVASMAEIRGPLADIVVGDFNITRGSASLSVLAPNARDAFASVGVGWGGTYPRRWPLWAIDQTLVREPWQAVRAQIVDPGRSRHRAQLVDLMKRVVTPE